MDQYLPSVLASNKTAIVKGLVGMGILAATFSVGSQLLHSNTCTDASFDCITDEGKRLLSTDKETEHHLLTLQKYKEVAPAAFDAMLIATVQLLHLHQLTADNNTYTPFRIAQEAFGKGESIKQSLKQMQKQIEDAFKEDLAALQDFKEVQELFVSIIDAYPRNIQLNIRAQ